MLKRRSHLRGLFLLLGVLLVLVDGNGSEDCDCKCSSANICETISEVKIKTDSNSGLLRRWTNPLIAFRDWFYNKDQYMLDLLEDEMKPHIDKKLEELVTGKISSGKTANLMVQSDDNQNSKLDMKETIVSLTRKLEEMEKEAEWSWKQNDELQEQLRETVQELTGELAAERRVREKLEQNLLKTQEAVNSLIASQKVTVDAIQKNISSSAENLNDRLQILEEDKIGNLNKKVDDLDAAVKDCASSHSLSVLDGRLQNLSEKTNVVDKFTHELSPHLRNLEKKIEVVYAAMNSTTLQKRTGCPSEEWVKGSGQWCYFVERGQHFGWDEANYQCIMRGGALAVIHSKAENEFVGSLIGETTWWFWIGLRRDSKRGDRYVWVDGTELSYTNWGNDEPTRGDQACVEIIAGSQQWFDFLCDFGRGYVCSAQKA